MLPANLLDHKAVKAWSQLQPERVEPEGLEIVKLKNKSAVYRLLGLGPNGSAVIAKRCPSRTAVIERRIYEELLPLLPVPTLRCYGFVEDTDGDYCWLFLEDAEDAGGQMYSPLNPEHRALAGRWLATLHTALAQLGPANGLPDRGVSHYLALLRACRGKALQHLDNPVLPADDVAVLQTIASYCDVLEAHWSEMAEICDCLPPSLVHGDFVIKNVRVRATSSGLVLLPFDWEYSGWGVPATDVAQFVGGTVSPDLAAYHSVVERSVGGLDGRDMQRLAECGAFFRWLDDISWEILYLTYQPYKYLSGYMRCLKMYEPRMAKALQAAQWL
jgi:aminoglycoside phosphotransferase (APT) family kinase protein